MTTTQVQTAVVTGGSRGIGLAVAEDLLARDWSVISVARTSTGMAGGRLRTICADLSTSAGITSCIQQIRAETDRVDLLVNNAGEIQECEQLMDVTDAAMVASWRLHTLAPLFLTRGLLDLLRRAPTPAVVNIGSIYGSVVDPEVLAYGSAKCGLGYVTSALAATLAPQIRVNAVLPGHVDTRMTRSAPKDFLAEIQDSTPLRRIAAASEIVKVIRFLASDDASFVTGASVVVDGGFMAGR